jgi:hypothetical protein
MNGTASLGSNGKVFLDLKRMIGSQELGEVRLGYDRAVTRTFFLPLALTCASFLGAVGMEWRTVFGWSGVDCTEEGGHAIGGRFYGATIHNESSKESRHAFSN